MQARSKLVGTKASIKRVGEYQRRMSIPPVMHSPSHASITTYDEWVAAAPFIASAPLVTLFRFTSILYSASMRRSSSGWTAALKDARMQSSSTRSRSAAVYVSLSVAARRASFSRSASASLCSRAASSAFRASSSACCRCCSSSRSLMSCERQSDRTTYTTTS